LAFLGALDFREYTGLALPGSSLVLHACSECGVCADPEIWNLTWIKAAEPVEILGNRGKDMLVGKRWLATEYPTPAYSADNLASPGPFLDESGVFFNFSCFADKIGGHCFRIQGHYDNYAPPSDSRDQPMTYIGQFVGTSDVEIGDTGIAYIFYSPGTGETIMYPEWF
jgi:hypothetical protein